MNRSWPGCVSSAQPARPCIRQVNMHRDRLCHDRPSVAGSFRTAGTAERPRKPGHVGEMGQTLTHHARPCPWVCALCMQTTPGHDSVRLKRLGQSDAKQMQTQRVSLGNHVGLSRWSVRRSGGKSESKKPKIRGGGKPVDVRLRAAAGYPGVSGVLRCGLGVPPSQLTALAVAGFGAVLSRCRPSLPRGPGRPDTRPPSSASHARGGFRPF